MEPNFIRPAMTSYLANHKRTSRPVAETTHSLPIPSSLARRALQVTGTLLIALGLRLAGGSRPSSLEPADDHASMTP